MHRAVCYSTKLILTSPTFPKSRFFTRQITTTKMKRDKIMRACTECQRMKQRCVFLKDSDITCVRCNQRNVLCVRKVSHQGERVKPKSTSAVSSKGKQRSSRSLDNSIDLVPISSKNVDLCTKEVPEPVRVEYLSPLTNVAPLQLCSVDLGRFASNGASFQTAEYDSDSSSEHVSSHDISRAAQNMTRVEQHTMHHGLDLDEFIDAGDSYNSTIFSTTSEFYSDSSGIRLIFEVSGYSNYLVVHKINSRIRVNQGHKNVAFIECTQLCPEKLKRNCRNVMIAYTVDGDRWNLGVIGDLSCRHQRFDDEEMNKYEGCLQVFQWNGNVTKTKNGMIVPSFYLSEDRNDLLANHLDLASIKFKRQSKQFRLCFINQFCGTPPLGGSISPSVINEVDGCVQCSPMGPDILPTRLFHVKKSDVRFRSYEREIVTTDDTNLPTAFIKHKKNKSRAKSVYRSSLAGEFDAAKWNKSPKLIRNPEAMVSVAVITKMDLSSLNPKSLTSISNVFKKMYSVISPTDFLNRHTKQDVFINVFTL